MSGSPNSTSLLSEGEPFRLGDKEIRLCLKERLSRASSVPKAILEELRVYNGNAIADVVSVHNYAHCYEIKSDKDSIERVSKQAQFYDPVFRKVTLVTTSRHAGRAHKFAPPHWGILIAKWSNNKVVFSHARPAGVNAAFDKQLALLTLWRSELENLVRIIPGVKTAKLSRKNLSEVLAENRSVDQISRSIGEQLTIRSCRGIDGNEFN